MSTLVRDLQVDLAVLVYRVYRQVRGHQLDPGDQGSPAKGTKEAVTSFSLMHLSDKDQLTHFYSRKSTSSPHSHLPFGAGGTNLTILTCITWRTLYTNSAVRTHIPPPTSLSTHISPLYCTSLPPHLSQHSSQHNLSALLHIPPPTSLSTLISPLYCTSLLPRLSQHTSLHFTAHISTLISQRTSLHPHLPHPP